MKNYAMRLGSATAVLLLGAALLVSGCGGEKAPATSAPAPSDEGVDAASGAQNQAESQLLAPTDRDLGTRGDGRTAGARCVVSRHRTWPTARCVRESSGGARRRQLGTAEREPDRQGTRRRGEDRGFHTTDPWTHAVAGSRRHDVHGDGLDDGARPGIRQRSGRRTRSGAASPGPGEGRR